MKIPLISGDVVKVGSCPEGTHLNGTPGTKRHPIVTRTTLTKAGPSHMTWCFGAWQ